jgi:cyanate lyase
VNQVLAPCQDLRPAVDRTINEPLTFAVLRLRSQGIYAVDVARAAGLSASVLSRLQNGHQRATAEQAQRLADLLELPVADLFPELAAQRINRSDGTEGTVPSLETSPGRHPQHGAS